MSEARRGQISPATKDVRMSCSGGKDWRRRECADSDKGSLARSIFDKFQQVTKARWRGACQAIDKGSAARRVYVFKRQRLADIECTKADYR